MLRFHLLALALLVHLPQLSAAQPASDELICVQPETQTFDKPTCSWSKELSARCTDLSADSIFAQCNVFKLSLNREETRKDDQGASYASAIFKYSETNECSTGSNDGLSILGRCDTFASYVQIFRNTASNKCYAMVNSALLGNQPLEYGVRNNPNKRITKVEIPGVSRRIIFTPSNDGRILNQANGVLIRSQDPKRKVARSGQAVSHLYLLELESPLTTKKENLKPNPAKIRISRGLQQESKDFFDVLLNKRQEDALNNVLASCS